MNLRVNGEPRTLDVPMSVQAYLESAGMLTPFMAVARNGDVLLKSEYRQVMLQDGDVLEIVRMVGGG